MNESLKEALEILVYLADGYVDDWDGCYHPDREKWERSIKIIKEFIEDPYMYW